MVDDGVPMVLVLQILVESSSAAFVSEITLFFDPLSLKRKSLSKLRYAN